MFRLNGKIGVAVALLLVSAKLLASLHSIAFFYGSHLPSGPLHAYDVVVVEPDHNINPQRFNTRVSQVFAYVSIGEVESSRSFFNKIPRSWFISYNPVWKADIPDQSNPKWRQFFMDHVITPLWKKGYRGFFLDTMDSYHLVKQSQRRTQQQGLATLIRQIKHRYPKAKLIFNRGFEFLPKLHQLVYAVAAESLFQSWNQKAGHYQAVTAQARDYLLNQFKQVKKYGLPAIAIDYVPPQEQEKARAVAHRIQQLGIIPWVSDGHLESLGVGSIEAVPRQLLVLYDSKASPLINNDAFTLLAAPLEYMGYHPVYIDVRQPLPAYPLIRRYAGIILWLTDPYSGTKSALKPWLLRQINQGMRVVFLQSFGFPLTANNLKPFHLTLTPSTTASSQVSITQQQADIGFEIKPLPQKDNFTAISGRYDKMLLAIKNKAGQQENAIAYTSWGGYALYPYVLLTLPNQQRRWIINPFLFIKQALKLPSLPMADTTTENGRRIMISHIDGDGFLSRSEWRPSRYAGEVIAKEIIDKYRIPITVSIIEAELRAPNIPKALTAALEPIAKAIFAKPWVEIASHTYSHPYDWQRLEQPQQQTPQKSRYSQWNMPIPNYTFSITREITGSVNYINRVLAPANKRCKVLLWSGNTDPSANAVAITYKDGLFNMNGGDTTINNSSPSLTQVAPLGIYKGKYFQVFAPIANENLYTNLWQGPFYGYSRVIETLKLTNKPRRLKPIDVYYHFYSGTKLAALKALKTVYDWSLKQKVIHLFVSDFAKIALDFNDMAIAKHNHQWLVSTRGHLRELRIPASMGYPDLAHSHNVIGFSTGINGYYLHLGPEQRAIFTFQPNKPTIPYLVHANGFITNFKRQKDGFIFAIHSYLSIQFSLTNMSHCQLRQQNRIIEGHPQGKLMMYSLNTKDSHALLVSCHHT